METETLEQINTPDSGDNGTEQKPVSKARKVFEIIKTIFVWIVVIFSVGIMIFTVISSTMLKDKDKSLFGIKVFIVLSDSMKGDGSAEDEYTREHGGVFAAGDLVVDVAISEGGYKDLKAGDIITYQVMSEFDDGISENTFPPGSIITHKIREVITDTNGVIRFRTYGTTTNSDDPVLVEGSQIVGKYVFALHGVGTFFNYLKTTPGFICCILIPFVILIALQGLNVIKAFRRYKAEQTASLRAEREQIANEKAETQRLMEELLALKAQMQAQAQTPVKTDQSSEDVSDKDGGL